MCLDPDNGSAKYQLERPSNTKVITGSYFQIFRVLVFELLQKVPNTGLVAITTTTMGCKGVQWIIEMCLGPDNGCAKYQLDRPSKTKVIIGS